MMVLFDFLLRRKATILKKTSKINMEIKKIAYLCSVIQRNLQKGRQPLWPSGRFEPQLKRAIIFR